MPSLSAEPAAPGWSREAALELCCSGPRRRLRRQLPSAGTGTGERSPPWPHSDSARWTPFRKERTLRPPAGHGPALTANAASPAARGKTGSWESGQPSPFCITPCPWTQHLPRVRGLHPRVEGLHPRAEGLPGLWSALSGGPGGAAGRALELLALGWVSLRQSRTMCPTLRSGSAYGEWEELEGEEEEEQG